MGSVAARKSGTQVLAQLRRDRRCVRIGCGSSSMRHCRGVSSSRLPSPPTQLHERHHDLLADRIDRRVGDLREVLLEVAEEQLRLARRAPRAGCRCPSSRRAPRRPWPSARGSILQVLVGVAERLLQARAARRAGSCRGSARPRAAREIDLVLGDPLARTASASRPAA